MDADVALVAEDHLISVLSLRRAAHVADHVLVVLDAQALFRLNGLLHLLLAYALHLHQDALHGELVQLRQGCRDETRAQFLQEEGRREE